MAALLSSVMDTKDRVPFYVSACAEMDLAVLPPDCNLSRADFSVTGEREIRFGLTAVKGVGDNAVAAIVAARDSGGPFASLWDFCRRVDQAQVNKRALECLIRGGALDATGDTRLGMLECVGAAVAQAARRRSDAAAGQGSLFGGMEDAPGGIMEMDPVISSEEMPRDELLQAEKDALGLYVSSHPLADCRRQLARATTCGLVALSDRADGEMVTVGGLVGMTKAVMTRRGEPMMFVRLDDLEGAVEVVVVPAVLSEARELLTPDAILLVTGRVDQKGEGETKVVAQSVKSFTPDPGAEEDRLLVRVDMDRLKMDQLSMLRRLLADHRGEAPVVLEMAAAEGRRKRLRLGEEYRVDPRDGSLVASLKTLFGERCVA
jgi:DNA polymerase-3 subunit alpha